MDENIATALYTGIMTDTGRLSYNVFPNTYKVAGDLIKLGANSKFVIEKLNEMSFAQTKLDAKIINESEIFHDNQLIVTYVHNEDYQLYKQNSRAIELLRNDSSVEFIALLSEAKKDEIHISLRSRTKSVVSIAKELGGGGHDFAAGGKIHGTLVSAREIIIDKFKQR